MDMSVAALTARVQAASTWLATQDNEHSRELLDYIESLEEALSDEGLAGRHVINRFYNCCPRVIGTGHKFGCSTRNREVYSATMNDNGTLTLGDKL